MTGECDSQHPCRDDDDPCDCPFIGPRRREYVVIPSANFILDTLVLDGWGMDR